MVKKKIKQMAVVCGALVLGWFAYELFAGVGSSGPKRQLAITTGSSPGRITVDVLEQGRPEYYRVYEITPEKGEVNLTTKKIFASYESEEIPHAFYENTGAVQNCGTAQQSISPDGILLARCSSDSSGEFIIVTRANSGDVLFKSPARMNRRIRGFGWSPNSMSVAVLKRETTFRSGPIEYFLALAGHRTPFDNVFIEVSDLRTFQTADYLIATHVPYSFARILSWSK